jgi:hypothetical protein
LPFALFSSQIESTVISPIMLKSILQQWVCALLLGFLPVTLTGQQETRPLPEAADFVQQILSRSAMPPAVSVTFDNISSASTERQDNLKNAIFSAFRNSNVRLVKPEQAVVEVQITFSEDWQGPVWIANIKQGSSSQLVIKRLPHQQQITSLRGPTLTVRKISVWQQDTPILDFYQDNQNLLVLDSEQLSLYASDSGQWRLRQTLGIPHQSPWPRDMRGRLDVREREINVFLPGERCTGKISPPSLDCRASDDPWPLDAGLLVAFYSPRRNFFSGLLAGQSAGASVVPFFSGATWQSNDQRFWIFTGTDGRARLFHSDMASPVAMFNGWGSTLAAVHSTCGSGWQLLTSSPADTTKPDSIQAIEINGRDAVPVSSPLELSGAVDALWTAGNYDQVVNGVLHSQSGKYEAFTLTVVCNQ